MALRRSLPALSSIGKASSLARMGRLAPPSLGVGSSTLEGAVPGRRDMRVLLPTGQSAQGSGVRGFGVVESVQNKIISRSVNKQEKQFKDQMKELSLQESFNLDDFAKIIEAPLGKLSSKLPWNKNRDEVKNMKTQKQVLDALTPAQRKNPEIIRAGHRQAIADRAGCTLEDVNNLLASFRELKAMHGWLSTRRKRKEKIPTSQEEMSVMASDPSGTTLMKFMRVKKGGSGQRPSFGF